jgi:hypothetical protein
MLKDVFGSDGSVHCNDWSHYHFVTVCRYHLTIGP